MWLTRYVLERENISYKKIAGKNVTCTLCPVHFFQKCNVVEVFNKLVCGTITVVFKMYIGFGLHKS
jgi:hypothetical protein